jgi:hypothetical protein
MPATELNSINAIQLIDFLDSIEDFSYNELDLYKFESLGNWSKMQVNSPIKDFNYFEYPDIFDLVGSLRKKYRYSLLKGYDIIDVFNCIRLAIAKYYWYAKESQFWETALNLVNEDLIFKVLNNFSPDCIEDFIENVRDGIEEDGDGLYMFVKLAMHQFNIDYEDSFISKEWSESVFNKLSLDDKKAIIYTICYRSNKFHEWSDLWKEFIFNELDEDLNSYKNFLLSISSLSLYKYWELVYDRLKINNKLLP